MKKRLLLVFVALIVIAMLLSLGCRSRNRKSPAKLRTGRSSGNLTAQRIAAGHILPRGLCAEMTPTG